jgi:hypothetical protein
VEFIIGKLKLHTNAETLYQDLSDVLMEDTETFMMKLWRMLIFEILKTQGEIEVYGSVQQV